MRELKFRVWDTQFKRMKVTGIGINDGILSGDDVKIMQFTGLLDKNGKPVYEGDILCFTGLPEKHQKPFVIEWNDKSAGWTGYSPKDQAEIIGNIHENPELMEEPT